jgi:hypothetical protein
MSDVLKRNYEFVRSKLDFNLHYLVNYEIAGFYDLAKKVFFYIDNGKLKNQVIGGNYKVINLFEYYFGSPDDPKKVVDFQRYFSIVQQVVRKFNLRVNVNSIDKSKDLGFPRIKQTLFKEGLLKNVNIIRFTLFKNRIPVSTLVAELGSSNMLQFIVNTGEIKDNTLINDYLLIMSDPELCEKEIPVLVKLFIPKYGSSPMIFHLDDLKLIVFDAKGYNPPKDREIIAGSYCRIIRTNKKFHNFNMDEIVLIQKVLPNSKTPQASKALCTLNTNPNKIGLVSLNDLKRM